MWGWGQVFMDRATRVWQPWAQALSSGVNMGHLNGKVAQILQPSIYFNCLNLCTKRQSLGCQFQAWRKGLPCLTRQHVWRSVWGPSRHLTNSARDSTSVPYHLRRGHTAVTIFPSLLTILLRGFSSYTNEYTTDSSAKERALFLLLGLWVWGQGLDWGQVGDVSE